MILAAVLPGSAGAAERSVLVTEADAGKEVLLALGDVLEVRLQARPGTGYRWEVRQVDTSVLEAQGGVVFKPSPSVSPGGQVVQALQFRTSGRGQADLGLIYIRPWERGMPPEGQFLLRVRVQ